MTASQLRMPRLFDGTAAVTAGTHGGCRWQSSRRHWSWDAGSYAGVYEMKSEKWMNEHTV